MSHSPPTRLTSAASPTQAKIRLFSLSPNIIREISLFLSHSISLLRYFQGNCRVYHIPTEKERVVEVPDYYKDFRETRDWRAVCIDDYQMMVCGGVKGYYASKQAYIVTNNALCRVEDMANCRAFHAILYYDFTHTVYVFGGAIGALSKLSTCEK